MAMIGKMLLSTVLTLKTDLNTNMTLFVKKVLQITSSLFKNMYVGLRKMELVLGQVVAQLQVLLLRTPWTLQPSIHFKMV